tara:strand:+ start:109 stop:348 length:240 start_codon:yes stop_codon:yes gene_type:complete
VLLVAEEKHVNVGEEKKRVSVGKFGEEEDEQKDIVKYYLNKKYYLIANVGSYKGAGRRGKKTKRRGCFKAYERTVESNG